MPRWISSAGRRSDPATVFHSLIPACHLLDDWLVWMEDACGQRLGPGGLAALPYLHRTPSLPSIGNSLGPDGDDETLFNVCSFLLEVVPQLEDEVRSWGASFTVQGPVYSRRLVRVLPDPTDRCGGWNYALFQAELSAPTAHEAVLEWLKRFCSWVGERFSILAVRPQTNIAPSSLADELPAFFQRLAWNCRFAAELLASMEQERRLLHATVGQAITENGEPTNSYGSLWRSAVRPWGLTDRDARRLSAMDESILLALHRTAPLTKKDLNQAIAGGSISGGFNKALTNLMNYGLIRSGGRGARSLGYSLTPLGLYAVRVVARHH